MKEWQAIAKTYNVSDVLTFDDWDLQLPLVAKDAWYALYHIPETEGGAP